MPVAMMAAALSLITFAMASCSQDEYANEPTVNEDGSYTYEMVLEGQRPSFDPQTRADDYQWKNNSKVYLQFSVDGAYVRGEATYQSSTNTWSVNANSRLEYGNSTCQAYYFENVKTTNAGFSFTENTIVYQDLEGQYSYDGGRIVVAANMKPKTARIRFAGTPNSNIFVKGLTRYAGYSAATNTFTTVSTPIQLVTEKSGSPAYTPYVYAEFTDPETRELIISDSKQAFRQVFADTVLTVGVSGYMDIPTADDNKGWQDMNPFAGLTLPDSISMERKTIIEDFINKMVKVESKNFNFQGNAAYPMIVSPFFIMQTEVTQKLYRAVMGYSFKGYNNNSINDDYPIYCLSNAGSTTSSYEYDELGNYQDFAMQLNGNNIGLNKYISQNIRYFVNKLNLLTGLHFDYPTEAEWEYAAYGGQKMVGYYSFAGNNTVSAVAEGNSSNFGVRWVAQKTPNELGLYDMTGNVSEVCYYIGPTTLFNTTLNTNPVWYDEFYCTRGGNNYEVWASPSSYATIANRTNHYSTSIYAQYYGIRLVLRYLDF